MFEYKIIGYDKLTRFGELNTSLNTYAYEGWRIVNTCVTDHNIVFTLERKIPKASDEPEPPIDNI